MPAQQEKKKAAKAGRNTSSKLYRSRGRRRTNAMKRIAKHLKRVAKKRKDPRRSMKRVTSVRVEGAVVHRTLTDTRRLVEIRRRPDEEAESALKRITESYSHERGSYGRISPEAA